MVVKLAFLQCRGLTLRIYIHGCEVSISSVQRFDSEDIHSWL